MEVVGITIHSIKYHSFITEYDNLVAAGSMYSYKDGWSMQHMQKAKARELKDCSKYFPKSVFSLSQNDATFINQLGQR